MNRQEAVEEYAKALKEGQKEYKECNQKGIAPNPAVLDEILEADEVFDVGDGRYLIVEA